MGRPTDRWQGSALHLLPGAFDLTLFVFLGTMASSCGTVIGVDDYNKTEPNETCESFARQWTFDDCFPGMCTVAQSQCNVTITCPGESDFKGTIKSTLGANEPVGTCTMSLSGFNLVGECEMSDGRCSFEATPFPF